jgi:hypothetical protein
MTPAAGSRALWENELGPLLTSAQVGDLLGGISRQRVDEPLRGRRLIALRESSGRWSYALFQFEDGRPIELLVTVFWMIVDGGLEEWSAASWCASPDPQLDGGSARDSCREGKDPGRLLTVARRDAARFSW